MRKAKGTDLLPTGFRDICYTTLSTDGLMKVFSFFFFFFLIQIKSTKRTHKWSRALLLWFWFCNRLRNLKSVDPHEKHAEVFLRVCEQRSRCPLPVGMTRKRVQCVSGTGSDVRHSPGVTDRCTWHWNVHVHCRCCCSCGQVISIIRGTTWESLLDFNAWIRFIFDSCCLLGTAVSASKSIFHNFFCLVQLSHRMCVFFVRLMIKLPE